MFLVRTVESTPYQGSLKNSYTSRTNTLESINNMNESTQVPDDMFYEALSMCYDESPSMLDDESPSMLDDESPSMLDDESPSMLDDESPSMLDDESLSMSDDESLDLTCYEKLDNMFPNKTRKLRQTKITTYFNPAYPQGTTSEAPMPVSITPVFQHSPACGHFVSIFEEFHQAGLVTLDSCMCRLRLPDFTQ
jgi:hypothetical protein